MSLTLEDALRAYAKALNTLNPASLEPILAVDFHYSSQMVFQEITSRDAFLDYFRVKLQAMEKSKATVFAEMGKMPEYFRYEPCCTTWQGQSGWSRSWRSGIKSAKTIRFLYSSMP
jgi:hypothetical protein